MCVMGCVEWDWPQRHHILIRVRVRGVAWTVDSGQWTVDVSPLSRKIRQVVVDRVTIWYLFVIRNAYVK